MNHLMIDIETLDTRPTSVVFQVGLLVFANPKVGEDLELLDQALFHLDILPQILSGRTIDYSTVKFWKEQQLSAWTRMSSDLISTDAVYETINRWMGNYGIGWVWSNSPSFDAVIMRSLRESLKIDYEFPDFRNDMDMRTLKQLLQSLGKMKDAPSFATTHNAMQDCVDQAKLVHYMLLQLGSK